MGGIAGWEYFNSEPGGQRRPWRWAQAMTAILRPGGVPRMRITRETAEALAQAWTASAQAGRAGAGAGAGRASTVNSHDDDDDDDYMALVNG